VKPNPQEVDAFKYVTMPELTAMMADPALLWSPWFRIIAAEFLVGGQGWWNDLQGAVETDKYLDTRAIHSFGPPFPSLEYAHTGFYRASQVGSKPVAKQVAPLYPQRDGRQARSSPVPTTRRSPSNELPCTHNTVPNR
jgi:hypothetical protein